MAGRHRGRPRLWDHSRRDPDYGRLLTMLQLAQGPIKPYQLAKEVLYREPPLPGDEFSHIRRLGTKLKKLLKFIDDDLTKHGQPNTHEDRRQAAIRCLECLKARLETEARQRVRQMRAERIERELRAMSRKPRGVSHELTVHLKLQQESLLK